MKKRKITGLLLSSLLFVQTVGMVSAQEVMIQETDALIQDTESSIGEAPESEGEEPAYDQSGEIENFGISISGAYMKSGSLEMTKPTCEEINRKYGTITAMESKYVVAPSAKAPYAIGVVSDSNLQNGITYTNFIRYIANMPEVRLGAAENEAAQYGAVVMAANDVLSHYPERPADMEQDFYEKGLEAASSSNIASGYTTIANAIQGFMNDNSSSNNLDTLGHRRWILYPSLLNTGFGYAQSVSNRSYIAMKVFRCEAVAKEPDYNFISWPASGYFPNDILPNYGIPWSITVNPKKYQRPSIENLKVTVTRLSDGKTWVMDKSTGGSERGIDKMFLHMNTGGYGVNNCIVFNLGLESNSDRRQGFNGIFTVQVDGLKTLGNEDASIKYAVNFFKLGAVATDEVYENDSPFSDILTDEDNWKYQSVKYVYENGIMGGVGGSDQFQPDNPLTRAMFATVLYRMAGSPDVTFVNKFSDVSEGKWYSDAIIWANQNGIVDGYTNGNYGIDDNITREQIAKMLYLYGKVQGYNVSGRAALSSFTDTASVSGWAQEYMQWAVDAAMISGKPNGDGTNRLDPKGQATRAECAKMLMMFQQKYKK